jgi:hypothetical protein
MKAWWCLILSGVVLLGAAAESQADWQVWTLAQTRRVLRDEPAGKGVEVKLSAARNEWESFQILMRSTEPIKGVDVVPGDLKGPEGAFLAAREARLYRQHQMEIKEGTYRNDKFKPGWYPDPLIPFRHPVPRQSLRNARLTAVPFDLPADQTHGFWVDIHVPQDAPPGEYRGSYRVTADDRKAVEIPVAVTVWGFDLPRVSTLVTSLGSPAGRLRGYYRERAKAGKEPEPVDWAAVEAQCTALLSEHRVNATPPAGILMPVAKPDGSFEIPAEQVAAFRDFVDLCHVNAFCTPHPSVAVKDPEAEKTKLHAWLKSWDRAAAALDRPVLFYTYLKDEPNDAEAYKYVQKWGKAVREAKSVVKVMVVEQTKTQDEKWGDLYGAIDIWCPLFSLHDPETAAKRQAEGETIWTYTALCQLEPTPWWHIDYPLLNYRVPAWMAWRYRMKGILYWGGMCYWSQAEDPWTDAYTYGRQKGKKGLVYNGEGTLVYPARAVGYDGIAPSLRLKALRDSIEDYEYLAILEKAGLADKAQEIVLSVAKSFFDWDKDPAACQKARAKLAELIATAKK